jgi:hypothetical protein
MKKLLALITVFVILGTAVSTVLAEPKEKEPIDSVTLIHYIDGRVKLVGGGSCSKLLGVKWGILPVSYVINPTNSGNTEKFVTTAIFNSAEEWDSHTNANLFSDYTVNSGAVWGNADDSNDYVFSYISNTGIIAVTRYWYTRYGRQIVDYDVLFNTYYGWYDCMKITCDASNRGMDLQNIATHETGHGLGLADIYNSACSAVTMYGYSWYGDTGKRTLEQPDIAGLQKLYGV